MINTKSLFPATQIIHGSLAVLHVTAVKTVQSSSSMTFVLAEKRIKDLTNYSGSVSI
jgi:phage-related protein